MLFVIMFVYSRCIALCYFSDAFWCETTSSTTSAQTLNCTSQILASIHPTIDWSAFQTFAILITSTKHARKARTFASLDYPQKDGFVLPGGVDSVTVTPNSSGNRNECGHMTTYCFFDHHHTKNGTPKPPGGGGCWAILRQCARMGQAAAVLQWW